MFCVQEAGIGGARGRNDPVRALWPGRGDIAAFEVRVHQLKQHSAWPCAAGSSGSHVARGQREACSVAGWRSCCSVQICWLGGSCLFSPACPVLVKSATHSSPLISS